MSAQRKIFETTKSLTICYLFNINHIQFMIVYGRSEMAHQQQVSRSRSSPGRLSGYWTCRWRVASTSTVCVCARGEHFELML